MSLPDALQHEIHMLALFDPASTLAGIKVHHDAEPTAIAAIQRLYEKGLVTLPDGGYLTSLGQEAVRHLDGLITILTSDCPVNA